MPGQDVLQRCLDEGQLAVSVEDIKILCCDDCDDGEDDGDDDDDGDDVEEKVVDGDD